MQLWEHSKSKGVFSAKLYGSRSHKNKKIVEENKQLFNEKANNEE